MAVARSNDSFDWCDDLARAKTNYSDEECLNIFKNHVFGLPGVDRAFAQSLRAASKANVKFINSYVPVYMLRIKATYTRDETTENQNTITTTTYKDTYTFSDYTTTGYNNTIQAQIFVGRNDDRWYDLSHVDDLPYGLFNSNCHFSCNGMLYEVSRIAEYKHTGSCCVNDFSATAVFVPVVNIYYTYNGCEYYCFINKHNGKITFKAPVSQKGKEEAKKAAKLTLTCKIIWIASFVLTILVGVSTFFIHDILSGILMLSLVGIPQGVLLYFGKEREIFGKNYAHFEWLFKNNGKITFKDYASNIIFAFISFAIFIASVIILGL